MVSNQIKYGNMTIQGPMTRKRGARSGDIVWIVRLPIKTVVGQRTIKVAVTVKQEQMKFLWELDDDVYVRTEAWELSKLELSKQETELRRQASEYFKNNLAKRTLDAGEMDISDDTVRKRAMFKKMENYNDKGS